MLFMFVFYWAQINNCSSQVGSWVWGWVGEGTFHLLVALSLLDWFSSPLLRSITSFNVISAESVCCDLSRPPS